MNSVPKENCWRPQLLLLGTEIEWIKKIEYKRMTFNSRLTLPQHLGRARKTVINRVCQLCFIIGNHKFDSTVGMMM